MNNAIKALRISHEFCETLLRRGFLLIFIKNHDFEAAFKWKQERMIYPLLMEGRVDFIVLVRRTSVYGANGRYEQSTLELIRDILDKNAKLVSDQDF